MRRWLLPCLVLLVAPPTSSGEEWYASGAPTSPMATALSGSPWDSLPPLEVGTVTTPGNFEILETRRSRRLEKRAAAIGWERPKRTIVVPASGFWRWRFRGGAPAAVQPSSMSEVDQLDISPAGELASRSLDGTDRAERVAQNKAAIQAGSYETAEKLNAAVSRLLDAIG